MKHVYFAEYVDDLMLESLALCQKATTDRPTGPAEEPPTLCAELERPEKLEAIQRHVTRFSKK